MSRKRVAVLISGRGSNMAALIAAAKAPDYPAEIAQVISNRPDAAGLALAADAGIATRVVDHKSFADRGAFDRALDAAIGEVGAELVCLAGFMRLFTPWFVARWRGRMLNIHPSLLPAFPGLHPQRQALAAGVRLAGCTVHYVSEATDAGPIIAQAAVPVMPGDDEASLARRILAAEHRLYPMALRLVAAGGGGAADERQVLLSGF